MTDLTTFLIDKVDDPFSRNVGVFVIKLNFSSVYQIWFSIGIKVNRR